MNINSDGDPQTTCDLLSDIIRRELDLSSDRVIIYNQRFKIPKTEGVFVVVEYRGTPHIISSRNVAADSSNGFRETQMINTHEMVAIGIMSANMEALQRKEEILMAINSIYAQSVQEANSFSIARISPIMNLSDLEGPALLYRFEIVLSVFAWYDKVKTAAFFDTFRTRVRTEDMAREFSPGMIDGQLTVADQVLQGSPVVIGLDQSNSTPTVQSIEYGGTPGAEGNWRDIVINGNLVRQVRKGGVWIEKDSSTP